MRRKSAGTQWTITGAALPSTAYAHPTTKPTSEEYGEGLCAGGQGIRAIQSIDYYKCVYLCIRRVFRTRLAQRCRGLQPSQSHFRRASQTTSSHQLVKGCAWDCVCVCVCKSQTLLKRYRGVGRHFVASSDVY